MITESAPTTARGATFRSAARSFAADASRLPWLSVVIIGAYVILAILAPVFTSYDPLNTSLPERLQEPGGVHLLGTDTLGRDYWARLLFGSRISLIVAVVAVTLGGLIGLAVGIVSGYVGGAVDAVLMRLTDAFMGLPTLLISLVFVMSVGPGLATVVIALSIVGWSRFARIIRSEVLSLKHREFVALARVAGASPARIMFTHILPNVLNTYVVVASLQVSQFVLTEATLSFLGAGVPPPTPTWGNMISEGLRYITTAWWLSIVPGVALLLLVLALNLLGDWLRDALDPRLRQA